MRHIILALLVAAPAAYADDLYALSGNVFPILRKLDPATGQELESHFVTGHQALFGGLGAGPSGTLYSIDGYNDEFSDRLFRIAAATAAGTVVGNTGFNWNFRCVSLNPVTGQLLATTDTALYSMNTTTGAATLIANITGPAQLDQATAIAVSPAGAAYITDIQNCDLFSLNLQTGQATFIASIGGNSFDDLSFSSGGVLYGARSSGVVTINIATGATAPAFPFNGIYTGLVHIPTCYANCDGSTVAPVLTANDFQCFINRYAGNSPYANCDGSTVQPVLTANDFQCFINKYAGGCP